MILHIKYMVSNCCRETVKAQLNKIGLRYTLLELGQVELTEPIKDEQRAALSIALRKTGFELMDNQKAILIEKIKNLVIEMVQESDKYPTVNYSAHLSKELDYDYTYISNLFSEVTGTTIMQYIIAHKIEKIKELLLYNELSLTQISYQLNYSSVAHLSAQFKKITGLTPTYYKQLRNKKRIALEDVGELVCDR
jgi:AraC-like DNA-binding protein